ncbi:MAG: class I SAM-dependent methyltransferase [Halioglobus sp.]|nr:class I SAM-dependent methyltransferase [Halioglobus sp.]
MKKDSGSKTAEAAAATRAYHFGYQPPLVFADRFAARFLRGGWRFVLGTPLRYLVFEIGMKDLRNVAGQVLARSRFAEDRLEQATQRGIEQYVIVGAGYDSYCLREGAGRPDLKIYELDHPDTQAEKRKRLQAITGGQLSANLELVPVDFETEDLAAGLARSSFAPHAPTFFSWLGTTPYLSNAATVSTLGTIAQTAAAGSEIVFDFLGEEALLENATHAAMYRKLKAFTARRGEPLIGEFSPGELATILSSLGLSVIEEVDYVEQDTRYFEGRTDDLGAMPGSYLLHARMDG